MARAGATLGSPVNTASVSRHAPMTALTEACASAARARARRGTPAKTVRSHCSRACRTAVAMAHAARARASAIQTGLARHVTHRSPAPGIAPAMACALLASASARRATAAKTARCRCRRARTVAASTASARTVSASATSSGLASTAPCRAPAREIAPARACAHSAAATVSQALRVRTVRARRAVRDPITAMAWACASTADAFVIPATTARTAPPR
mmetsp:Transcript_26643/g.67749  ORF Transcript_26643/g.67749 Transcript_26643/m.67749 type:complete len:215 (+) Transcript_26643:77-721(+)